MPFKPFSHLARVSFAKGVAHAYTPGAVVAGQQGLGQFQNYPASKFSKTTSHVQNAFSTTSSSGTGAGAKTGYASSSSGSGGDSSLISYFASLQHAQQTGDDTDYKRHQSARSIGWKPTSNQSSSKQAVRLDLKPADILRQSLRNPISRSQSDNVSQAARGPEDDTTEAQALAQIDQAIAREVKDIQESRSAIIEQETVASIEDVSGESDGVQVLSSAEADISQSPSTNLTSPIVDASWTRSEEIVDLGLQSRFADIPFCFQSMVQDGLVPSVEAYNYIIQSAISLADGYQPFPRAVEVFNDMTSRGVQPNQATYRILISFLTAQSLEASKALKELDRHVTRYGQGQNSYIFPSLEHKRELFSGDVSVQIAAKLYGIARRSLSEFKLSEVEYGSLILAYKESGSSQSMIDLIADMHEQDIRIAPEFYVSVINACAQVKDLDNAKNSYQLYRDLAISRNNSDSLDAKVYVALINAYYACGAEDEGLRFFEKILQSFESASQKDDLSQSLTDTFIVQGLVQHYIDSGNLHQALESLKAHQVSETARAKAVNKILIAAADNNEKDIVVPTFTGARASELSSESVMAVAAMYFRAGEITEAKAIWVKSQQPASLSFATMYGLALINAGRVEEALGDVLNMFRQIRNALPESSRANINRALDEPISLLGHALAGETVSYSSPAALLAFRLMIENGGLIPFITQAAIARIGPECVHQLSQQDIALALHVQAYMLPAETSPLYDSAQPSRFAHLLETVLNRRIGMDPATVHAIDTALPKLAGARPDLEARWVEWRQPQQLPAASTQVLSPVQPTTPTVQHVSAADSYDPYGHTTDHRASRMISEALESTTGRIENHLSDALSRLRNVRRMGRHLQYSGYAKLITAAGKAKQSHLMHEIFAMAQHDVPFNAQIPAVRNGWVSIYDSMVAASLTLGDRKLADKFHNDLLGMGAAPSANTFGIYITTLQDTFDEATEAVKIFQRAMAEGVTPTVFLFNAVIGKLGKARRIDDCLQYFSQMQNMGIRPSSVTYGTLVNALCRTSEETFAVDMFDEMEAAPNYRPRPAPYNSIIQYFLNTKRDRAKVLQYYGRMRSRNIKPTSHTYKLLIESYATLEPVNLTAAETVLEDMKANGVQPEAVHYGSLIHAKGCVLSDMAGARAVFDSVLADQSIKPTDNLYQNLLEAMVANHEVVATESILEDMQTRGIAMTPYIANTLIHGWASANNIEKARKIYEILGSEKREPSTYEAMTRAFLSVEGKKEEAKMVVQEMLHKGYPSAVEEKVTSLVGGM